MMGIRLGLAALLLITVSQLAWAKAKVINGCSIQPDTKCPGVNLAGAKLAGANFNGANLERADGVPKT